MEFETGPRRKLRIQAGGQAALILIMIMAVIGSITVGVASQSVENLRSSDIEKTSSNSFRAAEAALELALQTRSNVTTTSLPDNSGQYSATINSAGSDGFISDQVSEGDVVQASLVGAVGVNTINLYWNDNAAIMVSILNNTGANYSVAYYTADPDATRALSNNFSTTASQPLFTKGSYTFKGLSFGNRLAVPIDLAAPIAPKLVRVRVLYQLSSVGVEPVAGTLPDQALTINATGTSLDNISTNLVFSKFSERVPVVFDNVLYTNGSLTQ